MALYMTWYQDTRAVSLCSGLLMGSRYLVDVGITSQEDLINESQNLKEKMRMMVTKRNRRKLVLIPRNS